MAHVRSSALSSGFVPARVLGAFSLSTLLHLGALARQRRALARLDDAALADLGLTRDAAAREAARPVWDVPSHWR